MNPLKETIQKEYAAIIFNQEKIGVENQRKSVCKGIYHPIQHKYLLKKGYIDEANLGLGCGFPFDYISFKKNNFVLDLGCAAGIDCFIVSHQLGNVGKIIGIDITKELITKAAKIAEKNKIKNTEFVLGDIELMPFKNHYFDYVISNGVFSLVSSIQQTFSETFRVLKKTGVFCFSDIATKKEYDVELIEKIKQYTGCLNGILFIDNYVKALENVGFSSITVLEERKVDLFLDEMTTITTESEIYIFTIKAIKK
ncbi:MAG: arsenite S-adenosylmethyltransferase [Bacteroidetes bacterium HGW-Bacteroidetes-12]|nr:MAG: arsenite S-adenosylmethyltransferase [Bacteroidetes bacterium HGW-Bacteroidetes-12]